MNTPEYYGYKIGENIAPYINKCIDYTGECYVSEGIHIVGRNDNEWNKGNVWSDSTICWGWNRKHNVKLIGKGIDKTILRFIDDVHSKHLFNKKSLNVPMLITNYDESCNDNLIQGITFDGNYENNNQSATICAILMRGKNNTINGCKFINFGVGADQSWECFPIFCTTIKSEEEGPKITNNIFESVGKKKNSKSNHCPEQTFIAVGGSNLLVEGNIFNNCEFDIYNQQSPLHAITIGNSNNAVIINNIFNKFQGACIYMDSWQNYNALIKNNVAKDVYNFIALSCQKWPNENQISFNKNMTVENNHVELSKGDVYWQWDRPPIVSNFFVYNTDSSLDINKFPAFENIVVKNNHIVLGYRQLPNEYIEESNVIIHYIGNESDQNKIKFENNTIISTKPKPIGFFKKILNWFKKLFKS